MSSLRVRALAAADAVATREVVRTHFGVTHYGARILEQIDMALSTPDPEYTGLVATDSAGTSAQGLLLFGPLAGASRVVKVHTLVGVRVDVLMVLIDSLLATCARSAERMIVCEIADDVLFASASGALSHRGFVREGRVADYFRDGIALDILVWRP